MNSYDALTTRTGLTTGVLAHKIIASILDSPPNWYDEGRLQTMLRTAVPSGVRNVNERAVRQRLGFLVRAYFWHFALVAPWRLIASEFRLAEEGRVDIVWTCDRSGRFLFDEIKTSLHPPFTAGSEADLQTDRYARWGLLHLERSFAGVRCLPLLSVRDAFLKPAPTQREPLPIGLRAEVGR